MSVAIASRHEVGLTPVAQEAVDVRRRILREHAELRLLLRSADRWAVRAETNPAAAVTLRQMALDIYGRLILHLDFEDTFLTPVVRQVVGWGPVLLERLAADHKIQRERLRRAVTLAESADASDSEFAASVRAFVRDFLQDIEMEEQELLRSDLIVDSEITDGEDG